MTQQLFDDLKSLKCEGNSAFLPTEQLNDYQTLKKTLVKANGKYNRNKFDFPYPAESIITILMTGKVIDFKKEFQFFATPEDAANRMMQDIIFNKENMNVLEPSAGHGALIDAFIKIAPVKYSIDAIELSELNYSILQNKYSNVNLLNTNFLTHNPKKTYDLIIANPPFSKNQDIEHIKHMYSMLAKDGQLLTIASTSWTFGQQQKKIEFRNWLDEISAIWCSLESGTFKTSGTMVEGTYINISK